MNSAMLRSPEAEKAAAGSEPAADTADAKTAGMSLCFLLEIMAVFWFVSHVLWLLLVVVICSAKTEEKKDASNTALEEAEKKIADQK